MKTISKLIMAALIVTCFTESMAKPGFRGDKPDTGIEKRSAPKSDRAQLSALNAQFIKNFINQDVSAHNKIIHKDFVCIESNGQVVQRDEYMKAWATDYSTSGYTSFTYKDEFIRIFGNMALIRAITGYTRNVDGKSVEKYSIYTDTYIKENGQWHCIQAQITPVKG